jgi:predicted MFS family arabinose efflux permease
MADVTPPRLRAPCFGLILAVFSLAVLAGPPIGAALPPAAAPVVAIAVALGCMVATAAALPESLPEATAAAVSPT